MADGDEERLSKNEFIELIPHLSLQDVLSIECRVDDTWSRMIEIKDKFKKIYNCVVCSAILWGQKNLCIHIEGKKHYAKILTVDELFHPEYTYPKEQIKLASGDSRANETGSLNRSSTNNNNIGSNNTTSTSNQAITGKPNQTTKQELAANTVDQKPSTSLAAKSSTKSVNNTAGNAKGSVIGGPLTIQTKSAFKPKSTNNTSSQQSTIRTIPTVSTSSAIGTAKGFQVNTIISTPAKTAVKPILVKPNATIKQSGNLANVKQNIASTAPKPEVGAKATATPRTAISLIATANLLAKPVLNKTNPITTSHSNLKVLVNDGTENIFEEWGSAKPKSSVVRMSKKFTANTANIPIKLQQNNASSKKKSKIPVASFNFDFSENVENLSEQVASELVRNPFAHSSAADEHMENIPENDEIDMDVSCEEVNDETTIVITDDENLSDVDAANDSGFIIYSNGSSSQIQPTNSEEDLANITENDNEPLSKKQKSVRNPAAAFLEKASEDNSHKTPRYQTNLVIIPTVRSNIKTTLVSQTTDQPKFSTKTFSSKPNENDIHGLIGVEYVVKILKHRQDMTPKYECGLCELVLDGMTMQNHLLGYNHRLKFCERHFPTAIRQFRQYMGEIEEHEIFKVMTPILAKLAIAIEQHHGRDLPYECLERDFNINRHEILSRVFACRHASEQYGPTFTHVINSREVDQFVAMRHNYKPHPLSNENFFDVRPGDHVSRSSRKRIRTPRQREQQQRHPPRNSATTFVPSQNIIQNVIQSQPHYQMLMQPTQPQPIVSYAEPVLDNETHKLMVEDFLRGNQPRKSVHERLHRSRRSRSRSIERITKRTRSRSRSNSLTRHRRKSLSPLRDNDIWQAYRHLVDQKLNELNDNFTLYREDPEKHPQYNEEWEKFWKERKDALISAGLDHHSFNYQPEWVNFFEGRLEELYGIAIENAKIHARERLCLPMTNYALSDSKYHVHVEENQTDAVPPTPKKVTNVEKPRRPAAVSPSTKESNDTSEPSDVVAVLRLMTALEDQLGSLGPKIIELLSKALQAEKINPDKLNETILTNENCSLLETAMEKFKGLLIAGLMEGSKERALKKAVKDVKVLLDVATKLQAQLQTKKITPQAPIQTNKTNKTNFETLNKALPQQDQRPVRPALKTPFPQSTMPFYNAPAPITFNNESMSPLKDFGDQMSSMLENTDKKELSVRLASALTAHGKTDYDQEQLKKLIFVYSLIEKKKVVPTEDAEPKGKVHQKTLSDTLSDFLNPKSSSQVSADTSDESQKYTNESITNYVDMMRRSVEDSNNERSGTSMRQGFVQQRFSQNSIASNSGNNNIGNDTLDFVSANNLSLNYANLDNLHRNLRESGFQFNTNTQQRPNPVLNRSSNAYENITNTTFMNPRAAGTNFFNSNTNNNNSNNFKNYNDNNRNKYNNPNSNNPNNNSNSNSNNPYSNNNSKNNNNNNLNNNPNHMSNSNNNNPNPNHYNSNINNFGQRNQEQLIQRSSNQQQMGQRSGHQQQMRQPNSVQQQTVHRSGNQQEMVQRTRNQQQMGQRNIYQQQQQPGSNFNTSQSRNQNWLSATSGNNQLRNNQQNQNIADMSTGECRNPNWRFN